MWPCHVSACMVRDVSHLLLNAAAPRLLGHSQSTCTWQGWLIQLYISIPLLKPVTLRTLLNPGVRDPVCCCSAAR